MSRIHIEGRKCVHPDPSPSRIRGSSILLPVRHPMNVRLMVHQNRGKKWKEEKKQGAPPPFWCPLSLTKYSFKRNKNIHMHTHIYQSMLTRSTKQAVLVSNCNRTTVVVLRFPNHQSTKSPLLNHGFTGPAPTCRTGPWRFRYWPKKRTREKTRGALSANSPRPMSASWLKIRTKSPPARRARDRHSSQFHLSRRYSKRLVHICWRLLQISALSIGGRGGRPGGGAVIAIDKVG